LKDRGIGREAPYSIIDERYQTSGGQKTAL
jgi:hypothetical protein